MIHIDVNPIAFSLGSLEVRWYGIFVALSIIVLAWWMVRETRRTVGLSAEVVLNGALWGMVGGIVFAKLLHIIDLWNYYVQNPGLIFNGQGLSVYGAIIGGTLGIWLYSRRNKFPFAHVSDLMAPGIILAQSIGRVGCTFNGCCTGPATDLPWGVTYTNINSYAPLDIAIHPTQIYEIIFDLVVFGVLFKLRGKLKPNGSLAMLYFGLYATWRIGIGFYLREGTSFISGMQQAQVLGIIVLAVVIPLYISRRRQWLSAARLQSEVSPAPTPVPPADTVSNQK